MGLAGDQYFGSTNDHTVQLEHTSANRASKRLEAIGDETIVNLERYGNSAWAATIKLTTKKADGDTHDYFLKLIRGDLAGPRVLGEYACMFELAKTMPSLVPMPRAAGRCLDADDGAFFMCDYLEIDHRPANPAQLGRKIAELHRSSVSPNGKFGFHTTPYDGKLPLCAEWDSSWTSFFTKLLKGVYQLDAQVNGSWPELDDAMHLTLQTVVRLGLQLSVYYFPLVLSDRMEVDLEPTRSDPSPTEPPHREWTDCQTLPDSR